MSTESAVPEALPMLMQRLRPRLHRYCARMVGSVFEGEDIVQEVFAKAMEAQPAAGALENGERWLFTVAHNAALDTLRRRKRHAEVPIDDVDAEVPGNPAEAEAWIGATASLATLMQLPVIQRSAVVMLDVLEYSLAETVEMLESTLPAVKAAAHRGRQRLRVLAGTGGEAWDSTADAVGPEGAARAGEPLAGAKAQAMNRTAPTNSAQPHAHELDRLRAYADAFNARDFDKLRNLLAEDVKLDLVNRTRLAGSKNVSVYFTRYSERHDLKVAAGYAEGRPALLFFNALDSIEAVKFVVFIDWAGDEIKAIQDFHYADYIVDGLVARRG